MAILDEICQSPGSCQYFRKNVEDFSLVVKFDSMEQIVKQMKEIVSGRSGLLLYNKYAQTPCTDDEFPSIT